MTTDEQRKLFAEILQRKLDKVFEKHIEDLKSAYVSTEVGVEDVRKKTNF